MRFVATQKLEFMGNDNAIIILFTDGQQVGDGFNMEKKTPTAADLVVAAWKDLIPNLKVVRLVFAGVTPTHGIDNAYWRKIETFWQGHSKKANARSVSVSSERNIKLR